MSVNLENSAVATGLEKVSFHFNPKEGQCQRMLKLLVQLLCSFWMLVRSCSKSFKLGFSRMWTENFEMYKLGFKEAEEQEITLSTFVGSQRKQRTSRKTSTSASMTTLKPWTMWITTNCGKFLKRWEYQSILPVRNGHGTMGWFKIGKGVCQGWILSPFLFNLYSEYIMQNARLDEAQAGIKIARRNIN